MWLPLAPHPADVQGACLGECPGFAEGGVTEPFSHRANPAGPNVPDMVPHAGQQGAHVGHSGREARLPHCSGHLAQAPWPLERRMLPQTAQVPGKGQLRPGGRGIGTGTPEPAGKACTGAPVPEPGPEAAVSAEDLRTGREWQWAQGKAQPWVTKASGVAPCPGPPGLEACPSPSSRESSWGRGPSGHPGGRSLPACPPSS